MDAKETIKYLYEHRHILRTEHYETISNEIDSLSIQSQSRFNDWLLARAEIKQLIGLLGVAICPNAMNGCQAGIIPADPYNPNKSEPERCQWCAMTKQALAGDK